MFNCENILLKNHASNTTAAKLHQEKELKHKSNLNEFLM